jgi:hypothetical protein
MKIIIEYTDSEDDQMALKRAMKSNDLSAALFEIQINMKKKMVHILDAKDATDAEYDLLEKVWECINEELENNDINIDSLV